MKIVTTKNQREKKIYKPYKKQCVKSPFLKNSSIEFLRMSQPSYIIGVKAV